MFITPNKKVLDKFKVGEESIHAVNDHFETPNKSVMGTHTLCFTNMGRVFAYDSGGIFGDEKVYEYDGRQNKIKLVFLQDEIMMKNAKDNKLKFWVSEYYCIFVKYIYESMPRDVFTVEHKGDKFPCCIRYKGEDDWDYAQIHLAEDSIKFEDCKLKEIPYIRIKSLSVEKGAFIQMKGSFEIEDEAVNKLDIFILFPEVIDKIRSYCSKAPKVAELMSKGDTLHTAKMSGIVEGKTYEDYSVLIIYNDGEMKVLDQQTSKCVCEFSLKSNEAFYQRKGNILLVVKNNVPYYMEIISKELAENIESRLIKSVDSGKVKSAAKKVKTALTGKASNEKVLEKLVDKVGSELGKMVESCYLYSKAGSAKGILGGKVFNGEELDVGCRGSTLTLFVKQEYSLKISFDCSSTDFVLDNDKLFIICEGQVCLFKLSGKTKFGDFIKDNFPLSSAFEQKIGIIGRGQPFIFDHTSDVVSLYCSPGNILHVFRNSDITDIKVIEREYNTAFAGLKLSVKEAESGKVKDYTLSVPHEYVKELVYNVYYYAKKPLMQKVSGEQLYVSWGRMINDYILYNYFGQLFALYEGIKEITGKEDEENVKNREIANFLYYGIQAQKRRFDIVSIYLPEMLEQEEQRMLEGISCQPDTAAFKQLQRNLMGITSQIKGSLNEIENSLAAISTCIIPRSEMEKIIKQRASDGYTMATITALAGALAFPPLLFAGVFSGVNTYLNTKYMRMQDELNKENEEYRISFYTAKALDALEHLINMLAPYYVSEVSAINYGFFKQLAGAYKPALENPYVRESIFNQIARYYTFKQMPIDSTVTTQRKELVEKVQNSISAGMQQVNKLRQEVDGNVPKSISNGA